MKILHEIQNCMQAVTLNSEFSLGGLNVSNAQCLLRGAACGLNALASADLNYKNTDCYYDSALQLLLQR